uniref:Uncharacterized protein n=1 Tax=Triticum urartu TaxID=4572 RepID=A0A8R7QC26_TRIUA
MACGRRMSSSSTSTSTAAHAAPTPSWRRRWAEWNGKYRDHIRRFIKAFLIYSFLPPCWYCFHSSCRVLRLNRVVSQSEHFYILCTHHLWMGE